MADDGPQDYDQYDVFFENFKRFCHMYRVLATLAASLTLPPWQAYLAADTGGNQEMVANAVASTIALFSQSERLEGELQRHRASADSGGMPTSSERWTDRRGARQRIES